MLVAGAEARGERRDDERARAGAQRPDHGEQQRVVEREEVSLARHHHRLDRLSPAAADGDAAAADAAGERDERHAEQRAQPAEAAPERAG